MRSGYCSQSAPERAMTARVAAGSRVAPEMWGQGGAPPPPPPPGAFGTRSFDLQTDAHGQSRYTPGSPTYLAEQVARFAAADADEPFATLAALVDRVIDECFAALKFLAYRC